MRYDGWYDSCGEGKIHYIKWVPQGEVKAIVQIIHGMAEMAERYDAFAEYLCSFGYLVAAEDHMGHGKSAGAVQGFFHGGWMSVVNDCVTLMGILRKEYPAIPYAFLGHSMGSFLLRTILCKYPDLQYDAAVISGTGWQPRAGLPVMEALCRGVCRREGETSKTPFLNKLIFGSYNQKVEHQRTEYDWLTRDSNVVDAYLQSPDCGFPITAGMFRDLMTGLQFIESPNNLRNMKKDRPVLLAAGTMDPVGNYGKGVKRTAEEFRKSGLTDVTVKLYPMCRHEILNEINHREVYEDISRWLEEKLFERK